MNIPQATFPALALQSVSFPRLNAVVDETVCRWVLTGLIIVSSPLLASTSGRVCDSTAVKLPSPEPLVPCTQLLHTGSQQPTLISIDKRLVVSQTPNRTASKLRSLRHQFNASLCQWDVSPPPQTCTQAALHTCLGIEMVIIRNRRFTAANPSNSGQLG